MQKGSGSSSGQTKAPLELATQTNHWEVHLKNMRFYCSFALSEALLKSKSINPSSIFNLQSTSTLQDCIAPSSAFLLGIGYVAAPGQLCAGSSTESVGHLQVARGMAGEGLNGWPWKAAKKT